jgi:ABC-type nitrate/sulfonate/bicarbonate transport system ATPase subunit
MSDYTRKQVILTAENINLRYGPKQILRDVNFQIRNITRPGVNQGQVVSLLGRSGIGKTQLFKILAGLKTPTSGRVLVDEKQRPVVAGDMGVVFQNYYLFEWRTIRQSLELAARKNKDLKGSVKEQIERYAEEFDLTQHLGKYPQQLSGGQRQRVSIIQQLINGSTFLLFDEPFSGLDVIVLEKVVRLLQQVSLSDELKTLILVSHDIETSVALSDTVYILAGEPGKEGATIVKEIDLCARNLAWRENVHECAEFSDCIKEIKSLL